MFDINRPLHYILDGHIPVPVGESQAELIRWAHWFQNINNRRVALTYLSDNLYVSTVFLGNDYNFTGRGEPILFESMAFKDGEDIACERYITWEDAEEGHRVLVESLRLIGTEETPHE